jgi:hypothetical protein
LDESLSIRELDSVRSEMGDLGYIEGCVLYSLDGDMRIPTIYRRQLPRRSVFVCAAKVPTNSAPAQLQLHSTTNYSRVCALVNSAHQHERPRSQDAHHATCRPPSWALGEKGKGWCGTTGGRALASDKRQPLHRFDISGGVGLFVYRAAGIPYLFSASSPH